MPAQDTPPPASTSRRTGTGRRQILTLIVLFVLGDWLGAGLAVYFAVAARRGQSLEHLFSGWTWWVIALTVLVVLWYGRGVRRLAREFRGVPLTAQFLVYLGIFTAFVAVVPPLDTLARDLYFVHQIQHMLLHMIAPLLLALGVPLAPLIAGLPSVLRRNVLKPLVRNRALQWLWRLLVHPLAASLLFTFALYFWQIPHFMDLIALSDPLDEFAHATMLVSGLFFWWMLFDPRPRPNAVSYPTRLLCVTVTMFACILADAYVVFTQRQLYPVYANLASAWGFSPRLDQTLGGLITWIDGSMTLVIGALIVFHRWVRDETLRPLSRRRRLLRMQLPDPMLESAAQPQ
ncbi:MAG: cytochrome c oxidase assembly protein [Gammaproteobacteria bacterium]|nr:cytochrome c oxidase assembly protein [Gammaproteobacteria bacterium]MDE2346598.1 cytochrome c oxidase assembly protein [Gammaproteobacteria bacterium]